MFDETEPVRTTGGHQIVRHHLAAAQAKWERLTVSDYARIANTTDLIAAVEDRYSLQPGQAKRDVDLWLLDVGAQAAQSG
jgi:hypothetical protein